MQEYPKWVYHRTEPARIVNSEDELKELGSGWKDEPVKGGTDEVDQSVGAVAPVNEGATMTADEAFDNWAVEQGLDGESDDVKAMLRTAYTAGNQNRAGTIPQIEYGHVVGPQDEVVMVDSEEARKALLKQAKDMGLKVHHNSSSKTLQAAIDAHTAAKSNTPAALPSESDVKAVQDEEEQDANKE